MGATTKGFFIQGESPDLGYLNVRDSPHHEHTRQYIDSLWARYMPLADAHFREDAKNHFLQRFWEMYVAATFTERGLKLCRIGGEGPEFYFELSQRRIWVEAVAPGPGTGLDQVPEPQYGVATKTPTEKILLRFTHALVEKRKKYLEALEKAIVTCDDGYLLAINSRGIHHGPSGNTMPYFVQAFLPFGPLAWALDPKTGSIVDSFHQYRDMVPKQTGTEISTKAFLDPEFRFVSAVLHSSVDCVNYPQELGAEFCILHNQSAVHGIDPSVFPWARQLILRNDELVEI
ncbi:MAG: hypothetical protein AABZ02_03565 [Bacteroidota bacterium]